MYTILEIVDASVQRDHQRKGVQLEQDCLVELVVTEYHNEEKEVLRTLG